MRLENLRTLSKGSARPVWPRTWAEAPRPQIQAHRLGAVLKEAGIQARVIGAKETDHNKLNKRLGVPGDLPTAELFAFVDRALKP